MCANEIMTDERNDRQPKSNIAPTFSKRGYNNPNVDFVNMKAYIKFREILSICSQILSGNEILALFKGFNSGMNVQKNDVQQSQHRSCQYECIYKIR